MDSKNSNKIREIVRLQQILKKWRKSANASKPNKPNNNSSCSSKSIKFLKRTLSINSENTVPKGYLAVSVGEEQKRYIIPTEYLSHQAFRALLREAEEEFGFQQTGVLRIPCEVSAFEKILKNMEGEKSDDDECLDLMQFDCRFYEDESMGFYLPDCQMTPSHHHHPQSPMCR